MATGTSYPNYMCAVNSNCKSNWYLPAIINLNARSLSIGKLDELKVTVGIHDALVKPGLRTTGETIALTCTD